MRITATNRRNSVVGIYRGLAKNSFENAVAYTLTTMRRPLTPPLAKPPAAKIGPILAKALARYIITQAVVDVPLDTPLICAGLKARRFTKGGKLSD